MKKATRKVLLAMLTALAVLCTALLAGCTKDSYKLSFETGGGTQIAAIEAEAGEDISEKLPADPEREGFAFAGWYLEAECTGPKQTLPTVMPKENRTYYAKWDALTYAELTLAAGNGGDLSEDSFQVPVGTKLADFLTDKAPVPEDGLSFGGWFVGGTQIAEGATMPAEGLSLTAKYLASYTVNVYEMDTLGNYPAQPRTETGSSWYLEPFSYTAGSGFTIDVSGEGSYTSSPELQKNETFTVWLARPVRIGFRPGLEAGSYTGSVQDVEGFLGDELELPNGADYGAPEDLRFAGWARTEGGDVEFLAGKTSAAEICGTKTSVLLYARWETSISNVFGGSDYFFLSIVKENEVHLRRGPEEFTGTFDPSTGLFSFEEGVLEGKVMDGEHYFYFDDLKDKTFTFGGAESEPAEPETLKFGQGDTVVYHSAAGDEEGVYTVDLVTGEFIFEGKSGTNFPFSLNSQEGDEETVLVFNRPTSDERGFYAYRGSDGVVDTSRLFFLDGMVDANGFGGFRMYSYSAAEGFGVALRAFYIAEEDNLYSIGVSADGYFQEVFKLKPLPYTGEVENVPLKGVGILSDGLNGTYTDYENLMDEDRRFDLELDGFGNGTFRGESGTYRVETLSFLVHSGSVGDYEWEDLWIVFRAQNGKETIIRPVPGDIYGDMYYVLDKAPYFEEWQDNPYKVYGSFDPSLPEHASFYHYVDDDVVYVMVWYEDAWTGETVYELFDSGEVTSEEGSFIFHSETVGYGFTFYYVFRRDQEGRIEVSIPLGAEQEIHAPYLKDMDSENPEDVLTLDMWGNLHYDGETYAYGEWEEYRIPAHWIYVNMETVNLSVFYLGDDAREVYCLYMENYDDETGDLLSVSYYVLASGSLFALEGGDGAVAPFIWFLDELGGEEGMLAISLPDPDGDEYFFFGYVEYDELDGTYSFTPDTETDAETYIRAREYATYFADGFYFKVSEKDGAAHITDNGDLFSAVNGDGSAFEMDGYGNAVYTPAGEEGIEGAYEVLALTVNEDETEYKLFVSFTAASTVRYFFIHAVINDDGDAFLITFAEPQGAEAGLYYYYSNDGYLYYNDYLVFFGDGTDDAAGTVFFAEDGIAGTYLPTGKTFTYFLTDTEFATYEVTMEGGEPFIVAVSVDPITMQSGTTCRVYMQAVSEEYSFTTDEGEIECDGFIASYRTDDGLYYGYLLIGNYNDGSAFADDFSFDEDPDGKQAEFMALYIEVDGTLYAAEGVVVFDFDEEDRSVLVERDAVSGTYAQFKDGALGGRRLRLDGHGNATLTDEYGTVIAQGSYAPSGDSATEFLFVSEKLNFRFVLSMYSTREGDYYIYNDSADEKVYVGADLSVLALTGLREVDGSIADATYYTSYGVRYDGVFTLYTEELIRFVSQNATFYFNLKGTTFTVNEEDFIVSGGVLYAYQGPTSVDMLKIPDGVTEIADEVFAFMYYIGGLDLNKVEKIGDYAFYSVRELLATELSSESLTDIGDYAFTSFLRYEVGDTLYCRSLINSMNLPNVTHIGAYAFYGNTSLSVDKDSLEGRLGNVKLKAIEFIGEHAFTITRYAEPDRVLYLDLTEVDLSKLQIADDAFDAHPSSQAPESLGAPVHILIGANGAFAFLSKLAEKYRGNVEIVGLSDPAVIAETGWYSFAQSSYLFFKSETGELGLNTAVIYTYDVASYSGEWSKNEIFYSVGTDGTIALYTNQSGQWNVLATIAFEEDAVTLTMDEAAYYKAEANQSVTIGGTTQLAFTYEATVNDFRFGTELDITFTSVTYNGMTIKDFVFNVYDNSLTIEYAKVNETYSVQIDLAEMTVGDPILASRTVYSKNNDYRATFSGAVELNTEKESFYRMLSLEKKDEGGAWTSLGSEAAQRQEDGKGGFTYSVKHTLGDGSVETYTVVYHRAEGEVAAYIDVSVTILHALRNVQAKEQETYRADFMYSGDTPDKMDSLTAFYEYKDYGGYKSPEEVFGANIKKTTENTFTVTVNSASGVTVYTVVFHAAQGDEAAFIEVTKKEQRVVTVETEVMGDTPKQYYYEFRIIVDENNQIVDITGDLVKYTYDFFSGGYSPFTLDLSSSENVSIKIEGTKVTITRFGDTYIFNVTNENGEFSATVVSEPAD